MFPASDEQRYFLELELAFNQLRRSASLLSPSDWQVAAGWQRAGVPLPVVVATIERLFRQRTERGDAERIQSLRYCVPAVENAHRQLLELGHGEAPKQAQPALEVRVDRLIQKLGAFGLAHEDRIRSCLVPGDPTTVETRLAALRDELAAEAYEAMDANERADLEEKIRHAVEKGLEPLRSRLTPEQCRKASLRLRQRWLREELEIPPLSLF